MQRVFLLIAFIVLAGSTLVAQRYSPRIAQQVAQVAGVQEDLIAYESFGPKPTGSATLDDVSDWISTYYESIGYEVQHDSFRVGNLMASNIIIEKRGQDTTNWVVVGAHYDSVIDSYGANDNGTGVVATMQVARLIADIPTALSVRIINFSAEEQGFLGSEHYVVNTIDTDEKVEVMFNLDQLGGTKFLDNSKIVCERDEGNRVLANDSLSRLKTDTLAQIIRQYTDLKPVFGPAFSTDYMPFEEQGYTITGLYQESDYSSFNHSSADRLFNMDTDATHQVIQGAVAATLYFARPTDNGNLTQDFFIFPNPAKKTFRFLIEGHTSVTYSVYNTVGQQVANGLVEAVGSSVSLPTVSNGLYTVSISTLDGEYITSAKLIIAQ